MDESYFISIDNPDGFRKELLETSKEVILTLKDFQKLQSLRHSKLEMIEVLKDQIKELTFLMEKLDEKLPNKKIEYEQHLYEDSLKPVKKEVARPTEKPVEKPVEKKESADFDKLQEALSSIESKLKRL